ncbi:MAG TPA: TraM recognition domain-containing protein, partial [Candidatus Paceibacterota bacterium]|nr:TraM recognition domain-containing protein [Candidatus Paceibacterota bacterium]
KIWVDAWSARMEYILGNTLLALLEYPGATLLEVNRMLADKNFRNKVVANISDPSVKSFWVDEFAKYTDRFAAEATPAIQNKIGQFTSNPLIRNIIGQEKSSFDLRKIMDDRKILIINLSKGRVGEQNANLLGSMLITKIYLAALSRADIPDRELQKLPNFYLYVDEFQSFANESFANILSEARKYKLNLTIAHQYIEQMSEEVRAAVFGNVGTMITFRVGSFDAEVLEKEFAPTFTAQDIVNLGAFQLYLRLMINGIGSHPFSARSMPPLEKPEISIVDEIIKSSREKYSHNRLGIEENIKHNLNSENETVNKSENKPPKNNSQKNNFQKDDSISEKAFSKNNHSNKKDFAQTKTRTIFNSSPIVKKSRPMIDEKTKLELQKNISDTNNPKKDNTDNGVSLKEMSTHTHYKSSKNNNFVQNNLPKTNAGFEKNTNNNFISSESGGKNNSLREALNAVLKSMPQQTPDVQKKTDIQKIAPEQKKEEINKKFNNTNTNSVEKTDVIADNSNTKKISDIESIQKTQEQNSQKEIPERELKNILGVE